MKRLFRIILWIVVICLVLGAIAAAAIALFFPKEKARDLALEKLSSSLNREVKVESADISIWGGLGVYLKGIKIANPRGFTWDQFMEAEALDVKLKIWPLIRGEIQVDKTILVNPRIGLFKTRQGQVNYVFGVIDSLTPEPMKDKLSDESKMAATAISFENLSIVNGFIDYADDSSQVGLTIYGLNMNSRLRNPSENIFSFGGNAKLDSLKVRTGETDLPTLFADIDYNAEADLNKNQATIKNTKLAINGVEMNLKAGIPNLETFDFVNLEITSDESGLGKILALLPAEYRQYLRDYNIDGRLSMKALVKYNARLETDPVSYNGWLKFTDLNLTPVGGEGKVEIPNLKVDFDMNSFAVQIDNGSADLRFFKPMIDSTGQAKLTGVLKYNLNVQGNIKENEYLKVAGELSMDNGKYSSPDLAEPIDRLVMNIKLADNVININELSIATPSSDLSLRGTLRDPFPGLFSAPADNTPIPFLEFTLNSNHFDYDKMFPDSSDEGVTGAGSSPTDSIPISFPLPDIDAQGNGTFKSFIYSDIDIANIKTDITVRNGVIRLGNIDGDVYTGKVAGEFEFDLNDIFRPEYRGHYKLNQIEVNDFLTKFSGLDNRIYGKINMEGDFGAAGWEPEPIINSLTMDGDAILNQGKLVNLELLESFAEQLNLKLPNEETIRDLSTKFRVENGRVEMDDFSFISQYGNWTVGGSVGFDGSLDYRGSVLLTEAMSEKLLSQTNYLSMFQSGGKTQRLDIPFTLGGTYAKPKPNIDAGEAIKRNLKKINVGDKAKDLIDNLFGN